ncbi:MAG: hypothetical protein KH452_11690 [Clostridiales bacterium]|nr:hypothetical protein [Clostridiales bacterium]
MKKQMTVLLLGMMCSAFLVGCGNGETRTSEQTVVDEKSPTESAQQTETQESVSEEKSPAALDEPYVLIRETDTKLGTVTEYAYDENGDKVSKTVKRPNETMLWEYTTEYQEDGSKLVTESQGILVETGEVFSLDTKEYEYSSEVMLLRETLFTDGEKQMELLYEYDENGRLIRQNGTGRDMTKEFEYDESGNLIKQIDLGNNGEVEGWTTFEYDENGKEIMTHVFNSTGDEPNTYELCQWKYEYDEEGRVIKEWKEGTEHGGKYEHYEYEYDEYGNVCKKKDLGMNEMYEYAPLSTCIS